MFVARPKNRAAHLSSKSVSSGPNLILEAKQKQSPEANLHIPIVDFVPNIRKRQKKQANLIGQASSTRLTSVKLVRKKGGNYFKDKFKRIDKLSSDYETNLKLGNRENNKLELLGTWELPDNS